MARSICWYGPTGVFKTSQIKFLARYVARKTGKATLLLSTDGGGWQPCQPEVDAGMIVPYHPEANSIPLPILRKISQGYWPEDPDETNPSKINLRPIDYDKFGACVVEGWTSISELAMRFLPDKGISVGGEDRNKSNMMFTQPVYVEGQIKNETFGSNTRGDFGFTQRLIYSLTMNFNALPFLIVGYTALESKTEDDDRATTYGPAIAGKKGTANCGPWVGDLLHAQDYQVVRTIKVPDPKGGQMDSQVVDTQVRYYFKKQLDQLSGIPFPAKTRVSPDRLAELDKIFPGGYFEPTPTGGMDKYLEAIDTLSEMRADDPLRNWRERIDAKLGRGTVAVPATVSK